MKKPKTTPNDTGITVFNLSINTDINIPNPKKNNCVKNNDPKKSINTKDDTLPSDIAIMDTNVTIKKTRLVNTI